MKACSKLKTTLDFKNIHSGSAVEEADFSLPRVASSLISDDSRSSNLYSDDSVREEVSNESVNRKI